MHMCRFLASSTCNVLLTPKKRRKDRERNCMTADMEWIHCSLSAVTHAPFHASMLRPASQAGPMHETAVVGKLVNAALHSLINEACVNVCCTTLLSSELVGPACMQARSSNPRGKVCRPSGKGSGKEGILSDAVPVYLYCLTFSVSVSLGV